MSDPQLESAPDLKQETHESSVEAASTPEQSIDSQITALRSESEAQRATLKELDATWRERFDAIPDLDPDVVEKRTAMYHEVRELEERLDAVLEAIAALERPQPTAAVEQQSVSPEVSVADRQLNDQENATFDTLKERRDSLDYKLRKDVMPLLDNLYTLVATLDKSRLLADSLKQDPEYIGKLFSKILGKDGLVTLNNLLLRENSYQKDHGGGIKQVDGSYTNRSEATGVLDQLKEKLLDPKTAELIKLAHEAITLDVDIDIADTEAFLKTEDRLRTGKPGQDSRTYFEEAKADPQSQRLSKLRGGSFGRNVSHLRTMLNGE